MKRRYGGRAARPRRARPHQYQSPRSRQRTVRARAVRARRRLARLAGPLLRVGAAARRAVVALVLLAVVLFPLPGLASDTPPRPPACLGGGCRSPLVSALLWTTGLDGVWSAGTGPGATGDGSTVPLVGQAYVAVGPRVAVLGTGLSVTGYTLSHGKQVWQTMLGAPDGTVIMSVRAWPGVVTVGLLAAGGPLPHRGRPRRGDRAMSCGAIRRRYSAARSRPPRRRPSSSARPE